MRQRCGRLPRPPYDTAHPRAPKRDCCLRAAPIECAGAQMQTNPLSGNVQRGRGYAGDAMLTRARIERQALIELIAKDVAQNFTRSLIRHRRVMLTSQQLVRDDSSLSVDRDEQISSAKYEVQSGKYVQRVEVASGLAGRLSLG